MSRDCTGIRESFSEYLRGEVSGDLHRKIEGHLGLCRNCSRELEEFARFLKHISTNEDSPASDAVLQRIHHHIESRLYEERKPFPWLRLALPLAATLALLLLWSPWQPNLLEELSTEGQQSLAELGQSPDALEELPLEEESLDLLLGELEESELETLSLQLERIMG
ncbi:MAG: zf-HC2 domain-containing protein [Candidatus Krumholzibacteria bacterium]|jgi:predicted anti-sigma-YlaC factor YlaD|nr:zf-HC2 domain-containing protein [Candidatus Krumholzibacteria bacterium]MDP6669472.1 zf-HC2 domain-containing protein [Candidatus Krumholzibacteria bacterium]MDP6797871.1 zf-HC2 domain-containing protein [Candidatus Krumholzibacteria bacterium]MDP7021131.1 zf-HC2 domain-containing protein [Candidatus Krumholzibacteria bacterium]